MGKTVTLKLLVAQLIEDHGWDGRDILYLTFDAVFWRHTKKRRAKLIKKLRDDGTLARLCVLLTGSSSHDLKAGSERLAGRRGSPKYLDVLGDAFLLATLSSYDTGRGRVAPKKVRKLLWIDPALGYLAQWLRQGEAAGEAARAEWLAGAALLREFEARLWEGLSSPRNVFTWRSKAGNELDYLVVDRSRRLLFPVEVKYQRSIVDWDFQGMERAFGRGLLVTRDVERSRAKSAAVTLEHFLRETARLVG